MASVWLTIVGEGTVLFGIAAGVTAWVRHRFVPTSELADTPQQ